MAAEIPEKMLEAIRDFAPASEVPETAQSKSVGHPMAERHLENLRTHAASAADLNDDR